MIRYALCCDKGHEHEAWFASAGEYDRLAEAGMLACPVCNSARISKQIMAPSVNSPKRRKPASSAGGEGDALHPMATSPGGAAGGAAIPAEAMRQLRELKRKIMENTEDVGERFSEEARKIHYGEAEKRGIVGKATLEEAQDLWEEGVEVLPLPMLPEDQN